jgi:hypothetical protein
MTELTNQEYFDKTVKHIIAQGDACMNNSGCDCVYRNGTKSCAVGYWIPEGYVAENETGCIGALLYNFPELKGIAWPDTEDGYDIACSLQNLHDEDIVGTEYFEKEVNKIKFRFTLN